MLTSFTTFAATCKPTFLGLIPWYQYLQLNSSCDVKHFVIFPGAGQSSDIPLILAAVFDDILRIAGLVAVAFVLVGAIGFITSEGNSEKAAQARSTIINALAGLAITVTAAAFVNFLGTKFGG